jgi:16S rRNA U1498 N3-methylase RsmE
MMPEIGFQEQITNYQLPITNLVLDTTGKSLKVSEISRNDSIGIWVGPEGGWSEKEREKMRENGFLFARF